MASLIRSSRSSFIGLFDTVTGVASTVNAALDSANLGMDIVHNNVRAAHKAATVTSAFETECKIGKRKAEIVKDYSDFQLDMQRQLAKDPELAKIYGATMKQLEELQAKEDKAQA